MDMTLCTSSGSIKITWDDEQLNDTLLSLFVSWQVKNGPTPSYHLVIEGKCRQYHLHTPDGIILCSDERELFLHLEYRLTGLFQNLFSRNLIIHAACVERNGNGVLLVGGHGSGKTTLALTAISSGMRALTDDVAILDTDLPQVIGFPRPFKVNAHTWSMNPQVVPGDCPFIPCSDDITYVFFYKPENRYYTEKARLKVILFSIRHEGSTEIQPLGETDALRRILPQGFNFYMRKETLVGELLDLFRIAQPYELLYSDHWDAIAKVNDML